MRRQTGNQSILFLDPSSFNPLQQNLSKKPTLYAYPKLFSSLSLSSMRGMQETVLNLLKNNSYGADEGYEKDTVIPHECDITPLQISICMYIGSGCLQKHLNIVKILTSYGANINKASFYTQDIPENTKKILRNHLNQSKQMKAALTLCQTELKKLHKRKEEIGDIIRNFGTSPNNPPPIDLNERLTVDQNIYKFEDRIKQIKISLRQKLNQINILKESCKKKKLINQSPYVLALQHRHATNDAAIIQSFVEGAMIIRDNITQNFYNIDQETANIIVTYIVGLPLRFWDL